MQVKRNTHTARSHPIEERRHFDGGVDGRFGGTWRVVGYSSARVKVTDEPLYMGGRTSGLVDREG